jgi:hypothetical protein
MQSLSEAIVGGGGGRRGLEVFFKKCGSGLVFSVQETVAGLIQSFSTHERNQRDKT